MFRTPTLVDLTQTLDNICGLVHGGLGFGLPAVKYRRSRRGEMRLGGYNCQSRFRPRELCGIATGLRMLALSNTLHCSRRQPGDRAGWRWLGAE